MFMSAPHSEDTSSCMSSSKLQTFRTLSSISWICHSGDLVCTAFHNAMEETMYTAPWLWTACSTRTVQRLSI